MPSLTLIQNTDARQQEQMQVRSLLAHDPETSGHVERISLYSSMIYERMGGNKTQCEDIKFASMLHDIGKLKTPENILKKPGKLTHEERTIMQEHAMAGYDILSKYNSPMLKMGAIIASTHHEKWDGSGYPYGLKGEQIPLIGRIVALADVFDALSSKRCYKESWETENILELIHSESGTHFDPAVTKVFFDNLSFIIPIVDPNFSLPKAG